MANVADRVRTGGGSVRHVSASQINTWNTCNRRWGFQKLAGLSEGFAKAAQAGVEVHKILEAGSIPDKTITWQGYEIGRMARVLWEITPSDVTRREEKFTEIVDGIEFTGAIDFQTNEIIGDFKTTSKHKYVKSAATLADDPQRLIYVQVKPDKIGTTWLYGIWEDFGTEERAFDIDRKRDREKFKLRVLKPAEQIVSVTDGTDPMELEPNADSCQMYPPKGCPFKAQCHGLSGRPKPIKKTENKVGLLEDLRKEQTTLAETVVRYFETDERAAEHKAAGVLPEQTHPIGELLVDCLPYQNEPVTYAHTLIAKASADVAADLQLHHALLADYGKGPAMIAAQLASDIKAGPHIPTLLLETRSAEGKAVLSTLMSMSARVIRGFF